MTRPLVLIPGGSGYFGSLLLRKLLEQGARCRVFDLNDADDRPPEVEFIQGDICAYDTAARACQEVNVVYGFPEESEKFFPLARSAQFSKDVLPLDSPPLHDALSAPRLG